MNHRAKLLQVLSIILPFLLLFQTIAASATAPTPGDIRLDNLQTSTITFTPSTISMSAPELVNPMRGFHEWRHNATVPQPETSPDAYARYFWRDPDKPGESLETSRGQYNFSAIDADIAEAAAKGQKFAFRIRAMGSDSDGKRYIPDYLSDCGWYYRGTFIPDWNRSCFLDNAQNLIDALGRRYNNDPRIAWMDIGLYGRWGEWAMSEDIYASSPSTVSVASDDTLRRIVNMQLNAFPDVRKVMMVKTRAAAVVRALSSSDKVGWRIDCLGKNGYFDFETNRNFAAAWPYMRDRWKTAPVIAEFCASGVESTYTTAVNQVRDWHIATVGNGNIDSWSSKNSTQRANLITLGKTAGYRFKVKDVTVPQSWNPGSNISITTRWENLGVAPHYESTRVLFRLHSSSGSSYVWEGRSSVDLRTLLPTGGTRVTISDNLSLPSSLASGSYQLRMIVTDPAGYRKPLKLAIGGRQSDGSYLLGTVNVSGRTTQSTPEPTTPPPSSVDSQTLSLNPIADTYVSSSNPGKNFGDWTTVRTNNTPAEIIFLRFDLRSLSGLSITQARLRVRVTNGASGSTTQSIKVVSGDAWDETSLTFRNRPDLNSHVHGAFNGGSAGSWVAVDLTNLINNRRGQIFSVAVVSSDNDNFAFYTRESSNKPQLNITFQGSTSQGYQVWLPKVIE